MAGGKGVNVARALKTLGQPVIATGVAGGPTGTRIIEQLTEEAILNDFVRIREESRTSTAVVDPTSNEQTEINERGPTMSGAELVGHEFSDADDRLAAVREIVELGPKEAIVTLPTGCVAMVGEHGERELYRATVEPGVVDARSTVGSGDAFLAGYVAARYGEKPPADCPRFAVACGAESVQHFGPGVVDPREVGRLSPEVKGVALSQLPVEH